MNNNEIRIMKIMLDEGALMPNRAHTTDAGIDLKTPHAFCIWPGESIAVDTGVHVQLPPGTYGKIESKSGLNVKHGVVCCGGVIDEGYTGSIVVKLYNLSDERYTFEAGQKIAQMIVQPYYAPSMVLADILEKTERGDAGFGSTGK